MKMGSHIYLQSWEGEHGVMQAHSEVALTNSEYTGDVRGSLRGIKRLRGPLVFVGGYLRYAAPLWQKVKRN